MSGNRDRMLPPVIHAPTHSEPSRPCVVMTEVAIHTISLPEGHFAAVVESVPNGPASISIMDRDDVEAHIALLRNAMEDAERLDKGLVPIHATPSTTRQ